MKTRIHALRAALAAAALLPSALGAQDAAQIEAVMKKMRDQLRTTMTQLQTAQAENAALQAAKVENEAGIKGLQGKVSTLTKQSAADKVEAEKKINDLQSQLATRATEIAMLKETLGKWKEGFAKAAEIARAKEAERAKLASKVIVLERKVASHERKNAEMYATGAEILDRYEKFGFGTAIGMREPFVGIARVKLENAMQELDEKLAKGKIRPGDTPEEGGAPPAPESEAAAPAQKPADAARNAGPASKKPGS